MTEEHTYQVDEIVRELTGTDLVTFMKQFDDLPEPLGKFLDQSLMDHYKFLLHTERDMLAAARADNGSLEEARSALARRPGSDGFPVLNASVYAHDANPAGVIRAAHDTALASFTDLLTIARALKP